MKIRTKLFQLQRGKCCYCERDMYYAGVESADSAAHRFGLTKKTVYIRSATLEHLRRKADGGDSSPDNVALACQQCNTHRGALSWVEFKTLRAPISSPNGLGARS